MSSEAKADIAAGQGGTTDSVNGVVVGGNDSYYEFWFVDADLNRLLNTPGRSRRIGRGVFESDREAENYVKAEFPKQYAIGVEMRVY